MTLPPQQQDRPTEPEPDAGSGATPDTGSLDATTLRRRVLSLPTLIAAVLGAALLGFALWRVFDFEWTEVWEKTGRLAADVERINLDRKQVVITAFTALEATARP